MSLKCLDNSWQKVLTYSTSELYSKIAANISKNNSEHKNYLKERFLDLKTKNYHFYNFLKTHCQNLPKAWRDKLDGSNTCKNTCC